MSLKRTSNKPRADILVPSGHETAKQDADSLNHSQRDQEQRAVYSTKAEAFDYDGAEGSNSTRGNIVEEEGRDEDPALDIRHAFPELRPFPDMVFDTRAVASDTLDS